MGIGATLSVFTVLAGTVTGYVGNRPSGPDRRDVPQAVQYRADDHRDSDDRRDMNDRRDMDDRRAVDDHRDFDDRRNVEDQRRDADDHRDDRRDQPIRQDEHRDVGDWAGHDRG